MREKRIVVGCLKFQEMLKDLLVELGRDRSLQENFHRSYTLTKNLLRHICLVGSWEWPFRSPQSLGIHANFNDFAMVSILGARKPPFS